MESFEIGGTPVPPGSRRTIELPVARLPTGTSMSITVEVVHGASPGPAIWLTGAIHGDELDGVEIVRLVLDTLDPGALSGIVVAVPVVNLFGALNESRYLPDRRDLNRSFPGSRKGSMAGQLANLLMREVVARCDYGIDFHCGSDDRDNLPQVRADLEDEETRRLALAFGPPVVIPGKPPDGTLRKAAVGAGCRTLLYEGGEAWRFTPQAIDTGVEGTLRVLHVLGIVEDGPPPPEHEPMESPGTQWVRALRSGICRLEVPLGGRVEPGDRIAVIRDVLGGAPEIVRSRHQGIVIGRRINPLVYRGEAVVHIARSAPS